MKKHASKTPVTVLTIGHSTRTLEDFINLLQLHEVKCVVDIRTVPRSRHNPQFNMDSLPSTLLAVGIAYEHMGGLGGLRHSRSDSINTGWRNASFRGFADYMQTKEFENSLQTLIILARKHRIALMCAEAVPWRCHRSLISDALLVRGMRVEHIISGTRTQTHTLIPWARVKGKQIIYPPEMESLSTNLSPNRHVMGS
jgi:uncharacterized protein (DUF488 family)